MTKVLVSNNKVLTHNGKAIESAGSGTALVGTKSITINGTYDADDDGYDGYSFVTVNVPSETASLGTKNITTNGTYNAEDDSYDGYSSVTVNVSSGGTTSVSQKDVNFIDYDGTILYSYTKAEANALSALPANPSHNGLTAQGWNWTLAQIKAQLTAMPNDPVWVGQMYITQSGDTEIDVWFPDTNRLSPTLTIAVNGTVTVDWGDETSANTVTGTSLTTKQAVSHTYASTGHYTMIIHVVSGSFTFYGDSLYTLLRKNTAGNESRVYSNRVQVVRLGSGITSIGSAAFYNCSGLVSITIPSSVTSIGSSAFSYCYNLTSITMPNGITSIDTSTFIGCYSLASITIPSGVTSIGSQAFNKCSSLASITIPSGVTSIGNYAFSYCYNLTSITIPSEVTSINESAFYQCYSLASITIPSSVTSIGSSAFGYCYSLVSITIPNGVTTIYSSAFQYCGSLASITIPSNVISINNSTFYNCTSLTSITIPSGVTSIGTQAFEGCYGLGKLRFESTTPPTVANSNAFSYIPTDCIISVPTGKLSKYTSASNYPSSSTYTYVEE